MTDVNVVKSDLEAGKYDEKLADIYGQESVAYQKDRYIRAVDVFAAVFGYDSSVGVFSAPGRSEIGGNHTDHQHGNVLAASVSVDAIAVAAKRDDNGIRVLSEGYPLMELSVDDIEKKKDEEGKALSLIRGMLYAIKNAGFEIGGFDTYVTSNVLSGSGLSSSAAFETIIGDIISGLYNDMKIDAVSIAKFGQFAENDYFGKPCGLMDQMACSVGSLCQIDFLDPDNPVIEKIDFDLSSVGYSLCVTDTKGSHADLTEDYAAVPAEMKAAADVFGKDVLRDVDEKELMADLNKIREKCGDRAALRALHFVSENRRAVEEGKALKEGNFAEFLKIFKASGDSSYKYLQNVYTNHDVEHQNMSLALAVSEMVLGEEGCARVHGGGFAGTIQAFVKNDRVEAYRMAMDALFGENSCQVMSIRKYGGISVI